MLIINFRFFEEGGGKVGGEHGCISIKDLNACITSTHLKTLHETMCSKNK